MCERGMLDFWLLRHGLCGGDAEAAKLIVTSENADKRDEHGRGVIWHLMYNGPDNPDLLHDFLQKGATLHAPSVDDTSYPPLHQAAKYKRKKMLLALLDGGYPVDYDHCGLTPLDVVLSGSIYFSKKIVKILLDAGAKIYNPVYRCEDGDRNIAWAKRYQHHREQTRMSAIIVLGLVMKKSRIVGRCNGRDVLRMIARCVWSTRGHESDR